MSKPFVIVRDGKLFKAPKGKEPVTVAELMGVKPDEQGKHTGSIIFIDDEGGKKDSEYFEDESFRTKGKHRAVVFHSSVFFGRLRSRVPEETA